jgi:thiamine monophosphate synthase
LENLPQVLETGITAVAVSSAVVSASGIREAAI